ncbi:hypothetical protein UFOVP256_14 [uncultured Caudovirales phage]|uniref:Uncharacterized protein n=1 Tax=uncultured Caudovirales phage TaxID=2100421 RepID=A0A6J5LG94_9CAUD|nr:hypothetical protein UFOVP256_14 [uncultured Caudovirales phage]
MNKFERTYQIDNSREADGPREKHHSIELTDREHLERLGVKFSDDPLYVKFNTELVYRPPEEGYLTPALKEKKALAEKITKDTKVIDLNEKSKSKTTKRKPKKNNSKSNAAAVAKV